jgi:DNA-binding CsgD family transcriptional regulator/tetratricopeptide (TPR) repeat protein
MQLVERDGLLAELVGEAAAAERESGRVAVLGGPAGVGKTSVVRELAARTQARFRVSWGACDPPSSPRPLAPLHDMVGATALAVDLAGPLDRQRVFREVLAELSSGSLIVVEDAHWADEATLDLIRFLGRRIDRTRSMLIVTFRDDEVNADRRHPLRTVLGDLATAVGYRRFTVESLSLDGVRQLAAGHPIDAEHLFQVTGGNPFYVTEVLAAPGWTVPVTVVDAVLARVARLDAEVHAVLETAAVEPGPVEHWLLARLGIRDDAIDRATRTGVLVASGTDLAFRHELARMAIEGTLDATARRSLHRRVLAVLEPAQGIDPARLAHHAVGAGDDEAILRWATEAGRVASASGAHRQAAMHFERALDHAATLSPEQLADLLTLYALQLMTQDRAAETVVVRRRIVELRRDLGEPAAVATAQAELANAMVGAGDDAGARKVIADAVTAADGLAAPIAAARIYNRAGHLALIDRRGSDAIGLSHKAMAIAEREGDEGIVLSSLNVLGAAKLVAREDLSGIDDLERSARIAGECGLHDVRANALEQLGWGLGEIRRYDLAAEYLAELIDYAADHDIDKRRRHGLAWLARIRGEQGRWSEAAELAAAAMTGGGDPMPIVPLVALTTIGRVRARRGDPGARDALGEAWSLACRSGGIHRRWPVAAARAELAWLTATTPNLDEVTETLQLAESLGLCWAIGELAYWAWHHGSLDARGAPRRAAEPYRLLIEGRAVEAAAAWEAIGCPYEQATALAAAGDEASLRSALAILHALGARPLADRIGQQLRVLGATNVPSGPRPATAQHLAGLTPRQAEVLELLSDGLSDREIAERLCISERTANHHVSAVLHKLDARSRTHAIAHWRSISHADT